MPGGGEIRAGRAYVEVGVNSSIEAGLRAVEARLKKFGDSVAVAGAALASVGTAVGATLLAAANVYAEAGDRIAKASTRTGVSVQALQELSYAADQSGSSLEGLEGALRNMHRVLSQADDESKQAVASLGKLGLSVESLQGLSPDKQFEKIGDAIARISDPSQRAALAMKIFGKSGSEMLPLLENGAKGVQELRDRFNELNLALSPEDVAAAVAFGDIMDDIGKQMRTVAIQVGAAIAQALQPYLEATTKVIRGVIDWVREHRSLIVAVGAGAAAVAAAGVAILGLGLAIKFTGVALGGIVDAFGVAKSAILWLLSPIGLVTAALVGFGVYVLVATETGKKALAWLGEKFGELKDVVTETMGGIVDALSAGDLQLAARILWTGLKVAFLTGTMELRQVWAKFVEGMTVAAATAWAGIQELAVEFVHDIAGAWINLSATLKGVFYELSANIRTVFGGVTHFVSDKILQLQGLLGKMGLPGGMSEQDVATARAGNDADYSNSQDDIEQDRQASQSANEAGRQSDLAENERRLEDRKKRIGQSLADVQVGAPADAQQKIAEAQAELARLKSELDGLHQQAADEKKGSTKKSKKQADDIAGAVGDVTGKSTTAGTFNPAALFGLGGGGPVTKIEQNTRATKELIQKLLQKADKDGGLAFD